MSFDIGQTLLCDHTDLDDNGELTTFDIDQCPKCLGTGYYYDFVFINGQVSLIQKEALLEGLSTKHVLVEQGSSLYREIGTRLLNYLGEPGIVTRAILKRRIEGEVRSALSRFYLIQRAQLDSGQSMTEEEALHKIEDINVSIQGPRDLTVKIVLSNRAGRTIQFRL